MKPAEYVCAVKPGHRLSCGTTQGPPPQCCGQPMTLAGAAPKPAPDPK